ncbi:uncharacterized protein LOC129726839 isoform X2 [Wyeomyia smithii]|uniref:uncharacterized protein LOC129726839 isoform X2 n=1 Tax=Wyeomyia smithii TaxID=174621 RepID=UPI002468132E|nr:uncharacterized protein LOC129726839 isoform X2 [Wyeomyia smithii]
MDHNQSSSGPRLRTRGSDGDASERKLDSGNYKNYAEMSYVKSLLNDAANVPVDADPDSYEIQLPPWYDEAKFKRGQKFFKDNIAAGFLSSLCGLLVVFAIPSILEVLMFTRRSSTTVTAYKRYVLTILHTLNLYNAELKPGTDCWKTLAYVRRMHAVSSKQANASNSRMMVSQKDMAITQFGFFGYVVTNHAKLGIQYDEEGMEGIVHFWRTIGYMLGIQDRFNICTDSVETTKRRMELLNEHVIRPALMAPSDDFIHMSKAMIEGLWCLNTMLNYDAFLFFTRRLSNCAGHYYWNDEPRDGSSAAYQRLGWYSRYALNMIMVAHEILFSYALVRWYFNRQTELNIYFLNRFFPWLAILMYGVKNAYVRLVY